MATFRGRLAVLAGAALIVFAGMTPAATLAADPPTIVVADGVTQPVFSYADAIRERVWVPVPGVDQNNDGVIDRVALDIVRPLETTQGLQVPAIIDTSPYYTSLGRGNESEYLHSISTTQADKFPLYYDNYFVPRGYAFIAAQAIGTGWSTGCPLHGGPGDIAGYKAVIDWLRGRTVAYNSRTLSDTPVLADWNNGKNAMFGKSYDGTFANGVAATGVEGLTTIVPISAISAWYDYSRSNGVRQNTGTNYPSSLSNTITSNTSTANLGVAPPSNNASCAASRTAMNAVTGDANGNYNDFWQDRNYNKDVANVTASVFVSHGLNDDNVKPDHFSKWWDGLAANNVPRKLWLTQTGHVDPFDYRRATWVATIHRWYDYWLQGIDNGIMSEPRVMIETAPNVFEDHADWPLPGTVKMPIYLRGGATTTVAGNLGVTSGGALATRLLTDSSGQSETTMINTPTGSQTNRLVFLSAPLTAPLRVSGTPSIDMFASFNKTSANVGALIVDYNATSFQKITRSGEGITTTTTETCWGPSFGIDDACYREVNKPTTNVTSWRVSKGILDAVNRDSYFTDTPLVAGQQYELQFPTLPTDYTFAAGHQIGVILVSNYSGYSSITNTSTPTAQVTVDTMRSNVKLPIVGGYAAAIAAGLPDNNAPALNLPTNITTEATGPLTTVNYTVTATDTEDPSPVVDCSPTSGSGFAVGTTTVNCTATDLGGNVTSGSFSVTITDTTKPVVDPVANKTVEANTLGGAIVAFPSPTATDLVDGTIPSTCVPASGSFFGLGTTTTVTCSATDAAGNTGTTSFDVSVVDTTPPTITAGINQQFEGNTTGGALATYVKPTASDVADGVLAVICLPPPGSFFGLGDSTVNCSTTDTSGNTAGTSLVVTVVDTTPPTLTVPSPITVNATMPTGAVVTFATSSTDIVDATPTVVCTPASGSVFAIGDTTVSCTATDGSGNSTTKTFNVHVKSAAEQLADLLVASTGVGTGTSLADKVRIMQADLAAGRTTLLCNDLRNSYPNQVMAQLGKKLPIATALQLVIDSARIADTLGCP